MKVDGKDMRPIWFDTASETVRVTDSILRLSIGLEDAEDLKQDLDNALKKVSHSS